MKPVLETVVRVEPGGLQARTRRRAVRRRPLPAASPSRGSTRSARHANGSKHERRDREPHREEREQRVDRDRLLDRDERVAPDRGHATSASIGARQPPGHPRRLLSGRRWTRSPTVDTLGTGRISRPADLGHRPLQLPLRLLHAEGGIRPRLPVRRPQGAAHVRGDRTARPRSSSRTGSRRSGSRAASRSCGATSKSWSSGSPALGGLDVALTTNGALLAAEGRGARRRRAATRHGQPRLARRRRRSAP